MDIKKTLNRMTLEQKCALLSGKGVFNTRSYPSLGVPELILADGPHGIRKQIGDSDHLGLNESQQATCFPTSATIANSWDLQLGEAVGEALGREASSQGVHVLLGPGLNIKRSPTCGRNFEYFSEDPYLSGKMAAAYVRGIQKHDVAACPKHFAVNSQETIRMSSDSVIDERAMREIYLTAFEIVVRDASPGCLMTSYNKINGTYANEHTYLLKTILRDEWNYQGMVVTDWGGSNSHVEAVKAGSSLEMPACGLESSQELIDAVHDGSLSMEDVDARVQEVLKLALSERNQQAVDEDKHHHLAMRAAEQSIVLLKNEGDLLPLRKDVSVAVVGDFARHPRYQGAGSSQVKPTRLDIPVDIIKNSSLNFTGYAQGFHRQDQQDEELLTDALVVAKTADVLIVYIGLSESGDSEGMDRQDIDLPQNQVRLIERLHGLGKPMIAVISAGSAISMPWADRFHAILHGYLGGQAGAMAMLKVLQGETNPSGKLAETLPATFDSTPAAGWYPGTAPQAVYQESIFVGYRYYEKVEEPVLFPFGHGLSYASFAYTNLKADAKKVTFDLENTGTCDGAEVSQLYIGLENSQFFRPVKELKGFAKTFLKPGEKKTVTILLDDTTFRVYHVPSGSWQTEPGEYQVLLGASSRDIRLQGSIAVEGPGMEPPYDIKRLPSYFSGRVKQAGREEIEYLLQRPLPGHEWPAVFTENMPFCQLKNAKSGLARLAAKVVDRKRMASIQKGKPDLNLFFIHNIPFRAIAKMTNGMVGKKMVDGLLLAVNGHMFKGLATLIRGFFQNKSLNKKFSETLEKQEAQGGKS